MATPSLEIHIPVFLTETQAAKSNLQIKDPQPNDKGMYIYTRISGSAAKDPKEEDIKPKINLPLPKDAAPGDTIKFVTRVGAFTFVVPLNAKIGDNVLINMPTTSKLRTPLTILSYKVEKQPRLTPDAASKPQDERASAENPPSTESPQPEPSKKASASPLEHLMCPISYELPVDPVLAEDGNIYERICVEKHLSTRKTSPMTNLPMGKRLVEARHVTSLLHSFIKEGKKDDRLETWVDAMAAANRTEKAGDGAILFFKKNKHVRTEFEQGHKNHGEIRSFENGVLVRVDFPQGHPRYGQKRSSEDWLPDLIATAKQFVQPEKHEQLDAILHRYMHGEIGKQQVHLLLPSTHTPRTSPPPGASAPFPPFVRRWNSRCGRWGATFCPAL